MAGPIDAVSESMPVEVGQAVRVVQVRGLRVVVRPIDEEPGRLRSPRPVAADLRRPVRAPPGA